MQTVLTLLGSLLAGFLQTIGSLIAIAAVAMAMALAVLLFRPRRRLPADGRQDDCLSRDRLSAEHPLNRQRPSESPVIWPLRLTDDGAMVDRCEYSDILQELLVEGIDKVVVLYIHGWKHDACKTDDDLGSFKAFLDRLAEGEAAEAGRGRHIVGVYVGWNGRVGLPGLLENLTFWSRKRAADRISQSAVVSKLIGAISNIVHRRNHRDLVVLAGHSFGARILFTAVAQATLHSVQHAHPARSGGQYARITGLADLILLLNPAMEASIYTALDGVRRCEERFAGDQEPLMLTISTAGDLATRLAFPVGQLLGLAHQKTQLLTLGNFKEYITHDLKPTCEMESSGASEHWWDSYRGVGYSLVGRPRDRSVSPFVVARTHGGILRGHNDIWTEAFTSWLVGFVAEVDQHRVGG